MIDDCQVCPTSVRVHGYCPWSAARLASLLERGLEPEELAGDCVVTASGRDGRGNFEVVLSSALCCQNYYYWHGKPGLFLHGPRLFGLQRAADLKWEWNHRAILSLLTAEYPTGHDTLHSEIRKVPAAARMIWRGRTLSVHQSAFWDRVFEGRSTTLDEATDVLVAVVKEACRGDVCLSLSAGFDSRVILACLLAIGMKPVVGTMGHDQSTDYVVAEAIARKFGLEQRRVILRPEKYIEDATDITDITGGSKTADHWHTYIYIKEVGFDSSHLHWAGSNGEFARTTWFDYNPLARVLDRVPYPLARHIVTRRFTSGPYSKRYSEALELVPDSLGGESVSSVPERFAALVGGGHGRQLDVLDRFIAQQATRNFIGNGVSLYRSIVPTHSPFLDVRWITAAARLGRAHRVGSAYHRHVLNVLKPGLLEFPIGRERRVSPRPPWNHGNPKAGVVPYAAFGQVAELPQTEELLRCSRHLRGLFEPTRIATAIKRGALTPVLMALHFAAEAGERAASGSTP